MALILGDNFSYQGAKPLDGRLKYDTLADMKAVGDATMYDGCLAFCVANEKTYQWKSTNTVDSTTGKWREFTSGGGGGASDLSDLGDVDLSSPSDGQFLKYDETAGKWVNSEGGSVSVAELGDIGDVDLSSVQDGQIIKWDSASSKWINANIPSGVDDLNDLTDVNLTSPTDGQVLTYDAANQVWKNASGGSATVDHLGDITDVDLTNIADGQMIVWDATNTKWVNANVPSGGASDLTDLGDVSITTPSDGQILKYNATTSKWENTTEESEVVYGYAYDLVIDNPMDFIAAVNTMTPHSQITVSNQNIFSGKDGSNFMIFAGSKRAYLLYSAYPFEIKAQPVRQSSKNYVSLSRRTSDGVQHAGFASQDVFLYSDGITSIANQTIPATWTFDRNCFNDDETGVFYLSSTVDASASSSYYEGKFFCVDGIQFYSDAQHTTRITPEVGKTYIDTVTEKRYAWDGFKFVEQGVSTLSDLTDVDLSSPTDGQVLTYDATNQVWKNAAGGGGTVAHLGDITDVDLTNITDGQMIAWDATNSKWVNVNAPSGGASDLDDLTDVDITSAANGDVLKYNSTSQKWENGQGGGGASDFADLGDVSVSTPAEGDTIRFNAATEKWENIPKMSNGEIVEIVDPLPSGETAGVWKDITGTLTAGQTSITLSDASILANSTIDIYTDADVDYNSVSTAVGSVTVTFDAQQSNLGVKVRVSGESYSIPNGRTVTPVNDVSIWLDCAQIRANYTTITEVLADEFVFQQLIESPNALNYMVRSTEWTSAITINESAMNLIGLNNICSDKLLGDSTWRNAIAYSTYFESILNVKIPAMTSATTPSGIVTAMSENTYPAFRAVSGNTSQFWATTGTMPVWWGYEFDETIKAARFRFNPLTYTSVGTMTFNVEGSNDGSTWERLFTVDKSVTTSTSVKYAGENSVNADFALDKYRAYKYYRFVQTGTNYGQNVNAGALQIYGRKDVS